jgi:polyisoprenoid-binding protein YceI
MRRFICAAWTAFAVQPALAADTYALDAAHSIPTFEFTHLGVTAQTGRFDRAHGTVTLDPVRHAGSVRYDIDTASLNMGTGTETPDSAGFQLFQVAKFPTITFRSDDFYFDGSDRVVAASGRLTLLGVTHPLTVWVSHFKCSVNPMNRRQMCSGNVDATLNRSEWGMMRFIPAISDEIKISVPVEAYKD